MAMRSNLTKFLISFFQANNCKILHTDDGIITVQLTEEMDKVLMNRPFYWHYIKKMGYPGEPLQLTLITNPYKQEEKGERIHFGSPRLQQIIRHLQENEKYTKLFQQITPIAHTPLCPWLVINIKISYKGKYKRDELFSIGLNLINGTMKSEMMQTLAKLPLNTTISDFCYTLSPMIKLKSGYKRIEAVLDQYIENQDHGWAVDSLQALEEEAKLLEHFYKTDTEDGQMERELEEITERYQPQITYHVVNGGLFYLTMDIA